MVPQQEDVCQTDSIPGSVAASLPACYHNQAINETRLPHTHTHSLILHISLKHTKNSLLVVLRIKTSDEVLILSSHENASCLVTCTQITTVTTLYFMVFHVCCSLLRFFHVLLMRKPLKCKSEICCSILAALVKSGALTCGP